MDGPATPPRYIRPMAFAPGQRVAATTEGLGIDHGVVEGPADEPTLSGEGTAEGPLYRVRWVFADGNAVQNVVAGSALRAAD